MPPKASLEGLPTEIRQKIFKLIITPKETDAENRWLTENLQDLVTIHYSEYKAPRLIRPVKRVPGNQLLCVSQTFYREAAPLVYEKEAFYLFNDYDWCMWWRIQQFLHPPSFELYHMKHRIPSCFAFIRELAFQPRPEVSVEFVQAIETTFPSLHTLRAFRHIFLHEPDGRLTGELPDVWREFHRFVLLAAVVVTNSHPTLKYAKWSDWRYFSDNDAENSIRTITVKLMPNNVLSQDEVCSVLLKVASAKILNVNRRDCWIWNEYQSYHYLMLMLGGGSRQAEASYRRLLRRRSM